MIVENSGSLRLVVSLTTIPSRLSYIRPTLDSLIHQTHAPDQILLCLPKWSSRENAGYDKPDWLSAYAPRVRVVDCRQDQGPGTKLLGALDYLQEPTCLVIVDDDMRYKPHFLERLYRHQSSNTRASYSFYTYKIGPVTVGQGADGFSFYSPNLQGIQTYAERAIQFPPLRVVDDLWISAYLWHRGVKIESLARTVPEGATVYDISHSLGQLRDSTGDLQRRKANRDGLNYLLESGLLGRGNQIWALASKVGRYFKSGKHD